MRPSLLTQQRLEVKSEGELVVICVGNSELKMHYEAALLLSQWIRVRAKECKRRAGDASRHWSAIGVISDAEGKL